MRQESEEKKLLQDFLLLVAPSKDIHARLVSKRNSHFVHITQESWNQSSDLTFAPTFYLIAQAGANSQQLQLKLAAFNGKVLEAFAESFDAKDLNSVLNCELLGKFIQGRFKLCHGLDNKAMKADVLKEAIEDKIVRRSHNCQYALDEKGLICSECKKLVHEDQPLPLESSEEIDSDDIYSNEFLDKDDITVVSITSGLPEKLSKLSGISICKSKTSPRDKAKHEPKLTVLVNDTKELPFTDFRKDLNIEPEREKILRKKVAKPKQTKSKTTEIFTPFPEKYVKNCPNCDKPFTDITEFMKHIYTCETVEEPSEEDDSDNDFKPNDNEEGSEPKKKKRKSGHKKKPALLVNLECTVCMSTFKHETNFPAHMKAHEDKIDIHSPMSCPVCSIEVESKKALNPHIKENHPDKGGCCIECLEFMPMNLLKSHLSRKHHHAPEREGQLCPICGKKCYYTADLEIHIAVQHMGLALERPPKDEGEVMCHECGKVFSHRYRLKQHLSTTHNKSRDHPCPFCAKVFCLKHQLTKHLLTHADVKPFKCKYCDYQNVRKYRVTKHCQKQHRVKGTDEDIETMQGADKPSEFVHNVFGI